MQLKKSTSVSIKMRYATLQMRQLKRMSLNQNESLRQMTSWQFWPEYSSIQAAVTAYLISKQLPLFAFVWKNSPKKQRQNFLTIMSKNLLVAVLLSILKYF